VIERSVCGFTGVSETDNQKASEYWTLYRELADDEMKFCQYFRLSKHQFNYLLQKIEKDLRKKNTALREAVSPVEKLAACLR
jgi:hypothetical protein